MHVLHEVAGPFFRREGEGFGLRRLDAVFGALGAVGERRRGGVHDGALARRGGGKSDRVCGFGAGEGGFGEAGGGGVAVVRLGPVAVQVPVFVGVRAAAVAAVGELRGESARAAEDAVRERPGVRAALDGEAHFAHGGGARAAHGFVPGLVVVEGAIDVDDVARGGVEAAGGEGRLGDVVAERFVDGFEEVFAFEEFGEGPDLDAFDVESDGDGAVVAVLHVAHRGAALRAALRELRGDGGEERRGGVLPDALEADVPGFLARGRGAARARGDDAVEGDGAGRHVAAGPAPGLEFADREVFAAVAVVLAIDGAEDEALAGRGGGGGGGGGGVGEAFGDAAFGAAGAVGVLDRGDVARLGEAPEPVGAHGDDGEGEVALLLVGGDLLVEDPPPGAAVGEAVAAVFGVGGAGDELRAVGGEVAREERRQDVLVVDAEFEKVPDAGRVLEVVELPGVRVAVALAVRERAGAEGAQRLALAGAFDAGAPEEVVGIVGLLLVARDRGGDDDGGVRLGVDFAMRLLHRAHGVAEDFFGGLEHRRAPFVAFDEGDAFEREVAPADFGAVRAGEVRAERHAAVEHALQDGAVRDERVLHGRVFERGGVVAVDVAALLVERVAVAGAPGAREGLPQDALFGALLVEAVFDAAAGVEPGELVAANVGVHDVAREGVGGAVAREVVGVGRVVDAVRERGRFGLVEAGGLLEDAHELRRREPVLRRDGEDFPGVLVAREVRGAVRGGGLEVRHG